MTEAGGHEERVRMGIRRPQSVCNEKRTELCYLRQFEFSRFIELLELHMKESIDFGEHFLTRNQKYQNSEEIVKMPSVVSVRIL